MPSERSCSSPTGAPGAGSVKLGQPEPESYLVFASKSAAPQQTQWYMPSSWQSQYLPVNARSVPFLRVTWNCSGVSSRLYSSSVLAFFMAS